VVVFDTSTLILAIDPKAKPPIDPATDKPVEKCKERVENLLATLHKEKTAILIPTPVLAEYLVKAGPEKHEMLDKFTNSRNFETGPFDIKAAVEIAELLGDPDLFKKNLDDKITKAKIKFDRQIVAIAKTRGASPIYTDDTTLANVARNNGIAAVMTWEIEKPPEDPQVDMFTNNETEV
jgi:predicted nucleic acid-binding protein